MLDVGTRLAGLKGEALFDEHVPAASAGGAGLNAAEKQLVAFLRAQR